MEPWYKSQRRARKSAKALVQPDEFAIALEQVVAGTAPEDYRDPAQFFARTCFTRALREHAGMVLRRLSENRQHLAGAHAHHNSSAAARRIRSPRCTTWRKRRRSRRPQRGRGPVREAGVSSIPKAKVAVFVGNAWDRNWGVRLRGSTSRANSPATRASRRLVPRPRLLPGHDSIARVFQAAGAPVLLLFDEVLNYLNRHRGSAESFHAFIQNLTVATTGTTHGAAVISLRAARSR